MQDLELDWIDWDNGALRIGAMSRLQSLRDARFIPAALREALGLFTHAMFVISRPLVVKSPPGRKSRCCFPSCWHWMLNWFLATAIRCQSRTTACPCDRLLTEIIIKDPYRTCATRKISRSQAGLTVVTAAVAITDHDGMRIALDGVASKALRLHDVETQNLEGNALEQAVANAIFPQEDLRAAWPINAISREFW